MTYEYSRHKIVVHLLVVSYCLLSESFASALAICADSKTAPPSGEWVPLLLEGFRYVFDRSDPTQLYSAFNLPSQQVPISL